VFLGLVAASCGGEPEVASDDDDDEDGGSSGSGGSAANGGSGGGSAASSGGSGGANGGSGGSGGSTGGSGGAQGGAGGSVGGSGGSTGGSGGSVGGSGGVGGSVGGAGGAGGSVGGAGGTGGSVGGAGGAGGSVGGTGGAGGSIGGTGGSLGGTGGTGGSSGSGPAEVPAACAVVTSCVGCCVTVGAYALDVFDQDVTASHVVSLTYDAVVGVIANYMFQTPNETGGIFFRLTSEVAMEYLSLAVGTSGEALEAALVRGGGVDGCIYPMVGNTLSSTPSACWGLGAGPYYGIPVDQIEIRIRSGTAQSALLQVSDLYFY